LAVGGNQIQVGCRRESDPGENQIHRASAGAENHIPGLRRNENQNQLTAGKPRVQTAVDNIRIRPTFAWSSILFPYPGTPVKAYAQGRGFLTEQDEFLETNKRSSVLTFASPKEKRRIENLHKLFGLIVQFPFLRPFCTALCDLPLTRLYTALFYCLYGYNMKIRLYPFRSLRKELWKYIALWARFLRHK